jgi:hypothetical protein
MIPAGVRQIDQQDHFDAAEERSGRPTSRSAPCSPASMMLRAGCAGGLRPSLTAVPRGAGGISVGTKKRTAVKKRKLMRLDFDPAIRERMITSFGLNRFAVVA